VDPGPDGAVGALTASNVQLGAGSTLAAQLSGPAATSLDRLIVPGSVNLNNAGLQATLGFTPEVGAGLTLIQHDAAGPVNGTFNGLPQGGTLTLNGLTFQVNYAGGDGNDVVLTRTANAPTGPTPPTEPNPPAPPAPPITPSACAPRPNVSVSSQPAGPGRLRVTVAAGTQPATPNNRLLELRFQAGTNVALDINGQTGLTGPQTITFADRPSSVTFEVQHVQAGAAATLPFSVVDDCGAFQTLVGGGPNAF
jgi:hypothetical protein